MVEGRISIQGRCWISSASANQRFSLFGKADHDDTDPLQWRAGPALLNCVFNGQRHLSVTEREGLQWETQVHAGIRDVSFPKNILQCHPTVGGVQVGLLVLFGWLVGWLAGTCILVSSCPGKMRPAMTAGAGALSYLNCGKGFLNWFTKWFRAVPAQGSTPLMRLLWLGTTHVHAEAEHQCVHFWTAPAPQHSADVWQLLHPRFVLFFF